MRKLVLALSVPLLTLAAPASAHFNLTMPPSIAQSVEGGKGAPPCGPDTAATGSVTTATGGQALTLHIDETTGHKGFYRFALALKSASEFPLDDIVRDSGGMVLPILGPGTSATADYEVTPKFPVIADHVFVHANTIVQSFPSAAVPGQVILPNVNCDKCILQVDEFMAEHGSNGAAGYFYHHCAYLKITADPNMPVFDPNAGMGGAGGAGGASAGAGGTTSAGSGGASVAGSSGAGGSSGATEASGGTAGANASGGTPGSSGSPSAAGFSPSSSGAGTVQEPSSGSNSGGCSSEREQQARSPR